MIVFGFHPVVLADRQIDFNGGGFTDFFDRTLQDRALQDVGLQLHQETVAGSPAVSM